MNWIDLGIQAIIILVTLVLAWAKFDKKMALITQRLSTIEGNHLAHIERDMREVREDVTSLKLSITRIEEHLKK